MYRAVTFAMIQAGIGFDNAIELEALLPKLKITFKHIPEDDFYHTILNGEDIETEIRSIRDLLNNTKSSFDSYVQSNEKRFEDIETAFVDLEQNLVVHDTPTDEIVNNNLGTSTEISDNNVQLIIDEK